MFSGCKRLKGVVIPDSVKEITGRAFNDSGVTESVLNASRDTLIYCPAEAAGGEYTVPEAYAESGAVRLSGSPASSGSISPNRRSVSARD